MGEERWPFLHTRTGKVLGAREEWGRENNSGRKGRVKMRKRGRDLVVIASSGEEVRCDYGIQPFWAWGWEDEGSCAWGQSISSNSKQGPRIQVWEKPIVVSQSAVHGQSPRLVAGSYPDGFGNLLRSVTTVVDPAQDSTVQLFNDHSNVYGVCCC